MSLGVVHVRPTNCRRGCVLGQYYGQSSSSYVQRSCSPPFYATLQLCNLKLHLGIPLVDTDIPSEIEYCYIHHSLKVTNRSSLAMSLT